MTIRSGLWSDQNVDELRRHCETIVVCDTITENDCSEMIDFNKWKIDPQASFFCFCANETVNGFEFSFDKFPFHLIPKDIPICVDMSSNIGTTNVPWEKLGVVYMGAQKNLGTAGCTVVIVREDLIGKESKDTPVLANWDLFEKSPDTYYNTPAVFPMYVTGLNVSYMNQNGGLEYYIMLSNQKAKMLYDFIDSTNGYYSIKVKPEWRSRINCIFRI